jgi:hypothetical protein
MWNYVLAMCNIVTRDLLAMESCDGRRMEYYHSRAAGYGIMRWATNGILPLAGRWLWNHAIGDEYYHSRPAGYGIMR